MAECSLPAGVGDGVALTIPQRTHFQLYPVDAPWTATIEPGTDLS